MKIKYYYDTETCKYERVRTKTSDIILNSLGLFFLTLLLASGIYLMFSTYFESPKELLLKNEVKELEYYYETLNHEVEKMSTTLDGIEHRDDNIYRVVLGAEPIDESIRDAGVGGAERYADIKEKNILHKDNIVDIHEKVDRLRRKIYIESKSQDEVVQLA
ncbi:MAG: M23 family peptidase, partial [Cyclobacteriaceae bacterium]|nr:M23 family peptidase [Cyclobacteriaceae bacterium]